MWQRFIEKLKLWMEQFMRKTTRIRRLKTEFGERHRRYLAQRGEPVCGFAPEGQVPSRLRGEIPPRQLAELRAAWQSLGAGIMQEFRDNPGPPEIQSRWLTSGPPRIQAAARRGAARVAARLAGEPLGFRLFGEPIQKGPRR